MTSYRKPELPDPGHDRWWEIAMDDDRFELELHEFVENPYARSSIRASETVYDYPKLTAAVFERRAQELLDRLDKTETFVGTYNKNTENS